MKNVCIRNAAPLVLAALFFSLCMILLPAPAFAEEPRGSADMDNEALLMAYIEQRLSAQLPAKPAPDDGLPRAWAAKSPARERLSQRDQRYYDALKPQIAQVAAGERASTEFFVSYAQAGIKTSWTAAELGVDALIVYNGQTGSYELNPEAWDKISAQINPDKQRLMEALLADCPYELYWFDKTRGFAFSGHSLSFTGGGDEEFVFLEEDGMSFWFAPAADYAGGEACTVNTAGGARISAAVNNAARIVRECADLGDYAKLHAYMERICALASYNYEAARGEVPFGNPWQLIWVFDGDPATEVVCEGYAKAFQYLCDMSVFRGEISAYTVTGTMVTTGLDGPHMWNLVSMDDGKNYLVDVTNCDEGAVGAPDLLFMRSYAQRGDGYYMIGGAGCGICYYSYDETAYRQYDESLLTLSAEPYSGSYHCGKCGDNVSWKLQDGVLTISGTGDMYDYVALDENGNWTTTRGKATPWLGVSWNGFDYDYYAIQKVVVEEGVTSIGSDAFSDLFGVSEVSLPESVTRLGALSFCRCNNLMSLTIPAGVRSIGDRAFELTEASGLRTLRFQGDAPTVGENAFYGYRAVAYYPADNPSWTAEARAAFGGGFQWIPDGQTEPESDRCGDSVTWSFSNGVLTLAGQGDTWDYNDEDPASYKQPPWSAHAAEIRRVAVGEGIESVGAELFAHLPALEAVSLPQSLRRIHSAAFSGSHSLKTVSMPDALVELGDSAFYGCALTEIRIPEGVEDIHLFAFAYCGKLTTVYLPASLREIHEGAFYGTDVQTVYYAGGEADWSRVVISDFGDQNAVLLNAEIRFASPSELTLPANLLVVGEEAFADGTFSCVRLPAGLQRVESRAFANCANLRSVYVLNPDTVISTYAFGEDRAFLQSLTLYGEAGSSAERWAGMIGCRFVALP